MDPRVKAVIYPRPHQPTRNIASEKQRLARDLTEPGGLRSGWCRVPERDDPVLGMPGVVLEDAERAGVKHEALAANGRQSEPPRR